MCIFSGNNIGNQGGCALAESLKQNTTLTWLDLGSKCVAVFNAGDKIQLTCIFSGNNIGAEGGCALAKSLKQNMTLTQLT
jgi:hypothetical protein